MATNIGDTSALSGLASGLTGGSKTDAAKKQNELGKNEFLTLLMAQLKNQDPESPVDSKEFAVQLAQFSQVEQLIQINEKLGGTSDISSMASYLGHEAVIDASTLEVKNGSAGSVTLDLASNASDVKLELTNSDGEVVGVASLGAMQEGKHVVEVKGVSVPDGSYSFKVRGESAVGGEEFSVDAAISGIVTGVLPGADPKLIVNGQEVRLGEIKELRLAQKTAA